jgi:hypothetical protein
MPGIYEFLELTQFWEIVWRDISHGLRTPLKKVGSKLTHPKFGKEQVCSETAQNKFMNGIFICSFLWEAKHGTITMSKRNVSCYLPCFELPFSEIVFQVMWLRSTQDGNSWVLNSNLLQGGIQHHIQYW